MFGISDAIKKAMARTGTATSAAPDAAPVAGEAPAAPGAPAPAPAPAAATAPTIQASTVDTAKSDEAFGKQVGAINDWQSNALQQAQNYTQGLQSKSANSAARMGLAAGGASYLSGQRAAAQQGFNNMLSTTGQAAQALGNAYGSQASTFANTAGTNAQLQQSANTANTQQQWNLDAQEAQAAQQQQSNNQNTAANATNSTLKSYDINPGAGGEKGSGATWARAQDLQNAVLTAAPNTPEAASAQQNLNTYLSKLAALKQRYGDRKGNDWQDVLKRAEKAGFFDNPAAGVPKL